MGAAQKTVDRPPVRAEPVHECPKPGAVAGLPQMGQFVDHHAPETLRRLLGQLKAQPDPPLRHVAGAPAGAHVPDADLGGPLPHNGLAFPPDGRDGGEKLGAVLRKALEFDPQGRYADTVELSMGDGCGEIISLRLLAGGEEQAARIEKNFRERAEEYYDRIVALLDDNK